MVLRKGCRGDEVKRLQRLLGFAEKDIDGIFGSNTEKAVRAFQAKNSLVPDGIVGEKTWAALEGGNGDALNIIDGHINTHISFSLNRPIKYIAIHYTGGASSKRGSAYAERNTFLSRKASADFVVDDETIVQINPDLKNYYCWSVGDPKNAYTGGAKLYGKATNKNTVSIEICCNLTKGCSAAVPNHSGWYFTDAALDNALKLTRYLMKKYNVPKENVVRHYDISGKICPGVLNWNNANIYDTKGKVTSQKNNSNEWVAFWLKI